ncbi:MAG TPA: restriction endonuclease subunit S [Pyrinomonadaceae bacterium]|nr:restriction endonuclease subunit S [Pyrinomonadaceae bacterium]
MDAQQFLAKLSHIVSAPDGIQRVRELALQLAISGDLTGRIVGDIAASDLLAANKQEQDRLISLGQLKRQHSPRKIAEGEQPWRVPDGWIWCRLGDVTSYGYVLKAELEDVDDQTWVLELEDIEKGTSRLLQRVLARDRKFKSAKNKFVRGAVLYGKLRPYLDKVLIADEDGVCTTEIAPISFFEHIESGYLRWYLKSPFFITYATNSTHGMNLPRISTEAVRNAMFPFPPSQEQKRIVAKVDELMALCDKLEAQQEQRGALHTLTCTVTLDALSKAESINDLRAAWRRLKSGMSLILNEAEDVEHLRIAILELAIHGKLNIRESSVTEAAIERMRARKHDLARKKFIKRETSVVDFPGVHALRTQIPETWVWCRLNDIASVVRGGSPRPAGDPRFYGGDIPFLKVADVTHSIGMFVQGFTATIKKEGLNRTREITQRTVLLTNSGATLGVPKICTFRTTFNDGIAAFVELADEVFDEYLYFYLKAKSKWLFDIASRGQGQPNLNTDIIRAVWFPLPPMVEQRAIVQKVKNLFDFCDTLASQQADSRTIAAAFATACISAITGIRIEDNEKMKAPKTELISNLCIGVSPASRNHAPLATILVRHQGELPAKTLWGSSGMDIDGFYQQLKFEMANGWITQPQVAYMKELETV